MDTENNLMAERMPSLVSTRFDDRRATGLAGGWEVLRIFGRRKKAPLLRRGHELFESVKSDLGSSRIYPHASSPECQTPRKVARAIFQGLLPRGQGKTSRVGMRQGQDGHSGSVKVPLPEGTRQGDVVKLKLTVDHNKILHWWYSVGQGEFTAASPFNDPWTPRQLDPSEKRLLAFRRQMADELAAKNQLSDDTFKQELVNSLVQDNLLHDLEQLRTALAASYVTSGREIVRLEGSLKSKVQSLKSLVMGGPDFDLDLSKAGSASFQLAGSAGIPVTPERIPRGLDRTGESEHN
jgi:hypothetical protein